MDSNADTEIMDKNDVGLALKKKNEQNLTVLVLLSQNIL